MNKIIIYSNWFLRNIFNIFLIPITFITIILGIYGHIIDQKLNNYPGYHSWYELKTYIDFFENQRLLNTSFKPITQLPINESETKPNNHLFIVDRTISTINPEIDSRTTLFRQKLIDSLKSNFKLSYFANKPNNIPVKSLAILSFYDNLLYHKNISNICPAFYDGDKKGLTFLELNSQNNAPKWFSCDTKSSKQLLIDKINSINLFVPKVKQVTNFYEIFSDICKCDTSNMVITIISDFDHETGSISDHTIEELQKGKNKLIQLNLVYLPPNDLTRRKRSENLVKLLRDKFFGVSKYIELNIEDNTDDLFTPETYDVFSIKKDQCYTTIVNDTITKLTFYYPQNDNLGYITAHSRFKVNNIQVYDKPKWRVSSSYPNSENKFYFGKFTKLSENSESKFDIDGIYHEVSANDIIDLSFAINSYMQTGQIGLELCNRKINKVFDIRFTQFIPEPLATIGLYSVFSFILVYFVLMLIHVLRSYLYLSSIPKTISKRQFNSHIIWRVPLIIICIVIYIFCFTKINYFLNFVFWIIIIIHVILLLAFRRYNLANR